MKFLIAIALLGSASAYKIRADSGEGRDDSFHTMSRGFENMMASFFKVLNVTAAQELKAIWRNENSTFAQQKQAVLTWAEKYNRTEQVTEDFTNISNWKTAMQKNVTDLIAQLSGVNTQLQKIFNNEQQTRAEMFEAIKELRNISGQAVDVIFAIPKIAFGHHGKGGHKEHGKMEGKYNGHSINKGGAMGAAVIMGTHMLNNMALGNNKAHPLIQATHNKMASLHGSVQHNSH